MTDTPSLIIIGGNILLLKFLFSRSKASDANIANFVFVKAPRTNPGKVTTSSELC